MAIFVFVAVLTAVTGIAAFSDAALVIYEFSGEVTSVYSGALPTELQGIAVGDSVTGSYAYDGATSSSPNYVDPSVPFFGSATPYQVPNTFSLTIDSSSIPIGGGTLFVWVRNDPDGYIVQTVGNSGLPYYVQLGTQSLPDDTFSNVFLPTASITSSTFFYIYNTSLTELYLTASIGPLAATNPVPVPPTVWLLGSGLVGLAAIRRRMKK